MSKTRPHISDDWFTPEQRRAIFNVFDAMVLARKCGIHFWDNYGVLTAFNSKLISLPIPDVGLLKDGAVPLEDEMVARLNTGNFHAGNADDELFTIVYQNEK